MQTSDAFSHMSNSVYKVVAVVNFHSWCNTHKSRSVPQALWIETKVAQKKFCSFDNVLTLKCCERLSSSFSAMGTSLRPSCLCWVKTSRMPHSGLVSMTLFFPAVPVDNWAMDAVRQTDEMTTGFFMVPQCDFPPSALSFARCMR